MQNIEQLEGYNEMEENFLDSIPLERRLAGLKEYLRSLPPEELLPALPVEILRGFPEEYLRSFPPDVVEKIMERLDR
jgi:hypothetical protein